MVVFFLKLKYCSGDYIEALQYPFPETFNGTQLSNFRNECHISFITHKCTSYTWFEIYIVKMKVILTDK